MGLFARTVIGVDLGHASVKVVGVRLGSKPTVVGCAEVPLEPRYLQKEGFEDPQMVAKAVREAMVAAKLSATDVYAAISESLVFRKVLELPLNLSQQELEQVIRTQAAEYLPDSLDTVELDYQPLGVTRETQQVMVVAVSKRVIQDYLAVFSSAKLPLRVIDTKPSAVGRAIVEPGEKGGIVLIDIGSEVTSISVYDQRKIWVAGTVNMGGSLFIDPATGKVDEERRADRTKRLVTTIVDELDHTLKFYSNRSANQDKVKEIRLSGGTSMSEGLCEAFAEVVDYKVTLGKSTVKMSDQCDRRFFGALGSALYPLYEDKS
jgi:type IV pilus assembly protein PilM